MLVDWICSSLPQSFMNKTKKNMDVAVTKTAEPSVVIETTNAMSGADRKPVATVRVDECSASIWMREHLRQGKPIAYFSISMERSYRDRSGKICYTRSFDSGSLGAIVSLCQQANEKIAELQNKFDSTSKAPAVAKSDLSKPIG